MRKGPPNANDFHNRANTNYIVKYNLQTEQLEAHISVSAYSPRNNYYQWGGYSGMDLAVDEQGLWVLFGSTGNSRRLYAYMIDVIKNTVTNTWSLGTGKQKGQPKSSFQRKFYL